MKKEPMNMDMAYFITMNKKVNLYIKYKNEKYSFEFIITFISNIK